MKNKFVKIILALLVILSVYACSDKKDNNSSQTTFPPLVNAPIVKNVEAKIGEPVNQTITLKNPLPSDANITLSINIEDSTYDYIYQTSSNITNIDYSQCATKGTDGVISGTLKAGQECNVTYTFNPTTYENSVMRLYVDYNIDNAILCPTTDAKPTFEQIYNSSKQEEYIINNYALNSNGVKADTIKNVVSNFNYAIDSIINDTYTPKSFSINLSKDDTYSVIAPLNGFSFSADNTNCTYSNDTITALADGECTITVNHAQQSLTSSSVIGYIRPVVENTEKPVYKYNIEINVEQNYSNADNDGKMFSLMYYLGMPQEFYQMISQYSVVAVNTESTYSFSGNNTGAFKLVPTKYNGCTVTADKVTVPAGQTDCYVTVDFASVIPGSYSATLDINNTQYNISGTMDYISNLFCTMINQTKK